MLLELRHHLWWNIAQLMLTVRKVTSVTKMTVTFLPPASMSTADRMRRFAQISGLDTHKPVILGFLLDTQPCLVED